MNLRIPTLTLFLTFACSSPGPTPGTAEPIASGTRLQARQWTAAGTSPLTVAIFDRERRQDCQFQRATDGKLRCLPVSDDLVESGYCADPHCRQPLYRRQGIGACDGVDGAFLTVAVPPAACPGEITHEVRRLSPLPDGAPSYHVDGTEAESTPGALVFAELIAPESFVEGTESTSGSGRLLVRRVESTDGGRFEVGLADARSQRACTLSDEGGTLRCWPATAQAADFEGFFADADCKVPLAVVSDGACEAPLVAKRGSELFAVGERWTGKLYHFSGHGPCYETSSQPRAYAVGAPLPPDALATVELTPAGEGRLRPKLLRDETGHTLSPPLEALPVLEDPYAGEQNQDCHPVHTAGAGLRCLTATRCDGWPTPFFADARCSRRLAGCSASTRPIVSYRPWPTCHAQAVESVNAIDGVSDLAIFFGTTDACTELPAQSDRRVVLGAVLGAGEEAAFWAGFPRLEEGFAPVSAAH